MMIELTIIGGLTISVNTEHIVTVVESSANEYGYTDIKLVNGDTITVVENYFKILKMLK